MSVREDSILELDPMTPPAGPLVCAFGVPWADHAPFVRPLFECPACREETARMLAIFRAQVAAGEYDARGHKKR